MNSDPNAITSRNHCDSGILGGHAAGDRPDQEARRHDADVEHRLVFEAEAVRQLHGDVDRHHQRQVRRRASQDDRQRRRRRAPPPARRPATRAPHRRRSGGTAWSGAPVGLDVAGVVDQVDATTRPGRTPRTRPRHLDQHLAVVVVHVAAECGQRRGQHQQVLHPLPRADRLDDAGDQVLRRARRPVPLLAHRVALCTPVTRVLMRLRRPVRDGRPRRPRRPTATPVSTSLG